MVSEALQAACDNAIRIARRGDTRSSVGLARHAYRLARQESQPAELEALNALALCQTANGAYIESIATSIDAFALASLIGDRGGAAHALTAMAGSASFILDANAVALEMLTTCVKEATELGDTVLEARVHNTFGIIYSNLGRFDEGDRHYELGMQLVERGDNRASIFVPHYLFLGNRAYLSVQRLKAAPPEMHEAELARLASDSLARIERVMRISGAEANIDAEARAYFCLGQLRAHQGIVPDALSAFLETLKRASIIRHYPRIIDTQIEMGRLYREAGRYEDAMQALEAAYELADANRPTNRVPIICEGVAETLAKLGREREALLHRAKTQREREAFNRQNDHAMRDLQAFWQRLVADGAPRQVPA
jgi:tetratricopeptide (TPR) repeat protein